MIDSFRDFSSDFLNSLANNGDFRLGFTWGILVLVGGTATWWLFQGVYKQWLKVRKFFEPTKMPGKMPTETGPSPAGMTLGCIGRVLAFLLVPLTCYAFLWLLSLGG